MYLLDALHLWFGARRIPALQLSPSQKNPGDAYENGMSPTEVKDIDSKVDYGILQLLLLSVNKLSCIK